MKQERIVYKKIPFTKDQFFQAYVNRTAKEEQHILLESGRTGKYSIAGIKPFAVLKGSENKVEIDCRGERTVIEGNPLRVMEQWLGQYECSKIAGLPDFQGGAIGYISYDYGQCIENLPNIAQDDLKFPILYFIVFQEWAVFDHEEECLWMMALNGEGVDTQLEAAEKEWSKFAYENPTSIVTTTNSDRQVSLTEEEFIDAVKKIQDYISAGDIFQVNLTVRQSEPLDIPPIEVYKELRRLNPSPYMGYMHTPDFQIVSGSPELLIRKDGKLVSTRPIGGTRPRGVNDEEDMRLAEELLGNEKEQAEHIMLVDIERNDLGKVCEYGSVNVDQLMTIEKYSHVMHIVSHVSGVLAEEKSNADLIDAVFPGGTITGAPKVRTLEIIEELEPVKRGAYTGSLGWIGFNKDLHLNVIIRTMLVKDGQCHVQAGAGIVIDSDPKAEYEESLKKALALWKAKETAENRGENK
ncbi:anthranilate synthase component I family protein [Bacillus sp. FJAT-50079]|uniref:anthranilate synthase component I family protein n=1 Tax=Bacillus sp. FJAT-50079 TaxID=2833577 RepID=UPI001BC92E2D|nr:anthranilate synthase component I family protein [Bacillus sp. FJAT-50079]MBS4209244.1 anthranilate synthase component I family protein [Bacillus sp. FJAT-50079]